MASRFARGLTRGAHAGRLLFARGSADNALAKESDFLRWTTPVPQAVQHAGILAQAPTKVRSGVLRLLRALRIWGTLLMTNQQLEDDAQPSAKTSVTGYDFGKRPARGDRVCAVRRDRYCWRLD